MRKLVLGSQDVHIESSLQKFVLGVQDVGEILEIVLVGCPDSDWPRFGLADLPLVLIVCFLFGHLFTCLLESRADPPSWEGWALPHL